MKIFNEISPVAFALALYPHNDNNIGLHLKLKTYILKRFLGSGIFETDISIYIVFYTITIPFFIHNICTDEKAKRRSDQSMVKRGHFGTTIH